MNEGTEFVGRRVWRDERNGFRMRDYRVADIYCTRLLWKSYVFEAVIIYIIRYVIGKE